MRSPQSQERPSPLSNGSERKEALDALTSAVYGELRRLAHGYLRRERPGQTLQTTALIHEAYLRLADYEKVRWEGRAHFLGVAAQAMRRILVERARRRGSAKRGNGARQVSLDEAALVSSDGIEELLEIERALRSLEAVDPRRGRIVELRFYGGLSVEETADVLEISSATVKREWRSAKAWLYRAVQEGSLEGFRDGSGTVQANR